MQIKIMIRMFLLAAFLLPALRSISQDKDARSRDSALYAMFEKQQQSNRALTNKPYFKFSILHNGQVLNNETLAGKVVFINFWFKSCPPCMAEMKGLNELYDKFKGNPDFEFLSLTFENEEAINTIKTKYGIEYNVFTQSGEECNRLNNGNGYPTNIILNKQGLVELIKVGGTTDENEATKYIKENFTRLVKKLL